MSVCRSLRGALARVTLTCVLALLTAPYWTVSAAAQQQPLPQEMQERTAGEQSPPHAPHALHEVDDAMIRLPLAALLGDRRSRSGRSAAARRPVSPRWFKPKSCSPSSAP